MKTIEDILRKYCNGIPPFNDALIFKAKLEILELHKQELALKCKGIEEVIRQNQAYEVMGGTAFNGVVVDPKDLAAKLTEWIGKS